MDRVDEEQKLSKGDFKSKVVYIYKDRNLRSNMRADGRRVAKLDMPRTR